MSKKALLIIGISVAIIVAGAVWVWRQGGENILTASETTLTATCPDFGATRIAVGERELTVALAETAEEHAKGLSHCVDIPADSGMYFTFAEPTQTSFWMKNMRMPLDIIWVAGGQVVGVEHDVQPPIGTVADFDLTQYPSPRAIDAVLELPAGKAQEYGVTQGMKIESALYLK
jgi:uncharacterized protein